MARWKLDKLGITWGAAHEEAQPVMLIHGHTIILEEAYQRADGDYQIILPDDARIEVRDGRLIVTIGRAD